MNRLRILCVLTAFSGGLLLLPSCDQKPTQQQPHPVLKVMTLKGTRVPISITMVGQAQGIPTVDIRARVEGYLENWSFTEGSIVKKGQVLFTIEENQYLNNLDFAQADLANKEATFEYTQLNVARLKPLVNTNAISQNDFDVAVTQEKQAKAAVASARAQVEQAKLNLSYTTIISPISGYIGAVQVRPGNLVGRGESTLLATVSAVDPIYVNFQMNEPDFLSITKWMANNKDKLKGGADLEGNQSVPVFLTLSDKELYPHAGTIDFVGREVDASTGSIALRAKFPNPDGIIKPGAYAEVRLILGERDNGILVPQSTIQPIQDKDFVFLVDSANAIRRIPVVTGQHFRNNVVINQGLKPGDRILLEGYQKIYEGLVITPAQMADTLTAQQN
ncbi:MAG: efflux RND transporter periplasmic adaptor subunit [Bacteroidales bacterium]|nr:efflux RND transporter periplasmic adaptor subunit [Bacteroidales bacterium]